MTKETWRDRERDGFARPTVLNRHELGIVRRGEVWPGQLVPGQKVASPEHLTSNQH